MSGATTTHTIACGQAVEGASGGVLDLERRKAGDHLCCIYESEEEHRAVVAPYVRIGLERNERVIYVVDAHTAEDILSYLRNDNVDVDRATTSGQLQILTAEQSYLRQGSFDPDAMIDLLRSATDQAIADGYSALRVTGEMTWVLRGAPGSDRLIEYEAKLNRFFPGSKAHAICQYDLRRFDPSIINAVLDTHPYVVLGSRVIKNFRYIEPDLYLSPQRAEREMLSRLAALRGQDTAIRNGNLAEMALRERESQLSHALSMGRMGYWELDIAAGLFTLSEEFFATLHTSTQEMGGNQMTIDEYAKRFVHPDDAHMVADEAQKALDASDSTYTRYVEHRIIYADGSPGYIAVRLFIVKDAEGKTIKIYGVNQDITEQRSMRSALEDSERRYKDLFDTMVEGFALHEIILDESGAPVDYRFLAANPAFESFTGLKASGIIGRRLLEVLPETEPYWIKTYGNVALTGKPAHFENYSGSQEKHFEVLAYRPAPGQFACVFSDITDRKLAENALKESQQRLELATKSASLGIWDWDVANNDMDWDDQMFSLYGLKERPDTYCVDIWQSSLHPDDKDRAIAECQAALDGEKDFDTKFRVVHPDGSIHHIHGHGIVIRDEDGKAVRMLGVNADVTEQHRLEENLRQMEKMDAIGQLAGGIAHDFNNQLSGILGYADMLSRRLNDPTLKHYAGNVCKGAHRSADLTKKLLAFSRKGQVEHLPVNLHDVVEEAVDMLKHSIDKKISIVMRLNASTPITKGDASLLQNAILNLSINARDAMPNGGELIIETSMSVLDPEHSRNLPFDFAPGDFVSVSITDTGCGMTPEIISHCFEPFYTTKEVGKGTGMGLAAVYGTVKQHGGTINVYSEVGKGTTFRLYLPLNEDVSVARKKDSQILRPVKSAHILVVDDEEMLRMLSRDILESAGHEVMVAATPTEAISCYKNHWRVIDMVILDFNMPGMNELEAFDELRQINPNAKAIISSGFAISDHLQQMINNREVGLLQKPFEQQTLLAMVQKTLSRKL